MLHSHLILLITCMIRDWIGLHWVLLITIINCLWIMMSNKAMILTGELHFNCQKGVWKKEGFAWGDSSPCIPGTSWLQLVQLIYKAPMLGARKIYKVPLSHRGCATLYMIWKYYYLHWKWQLHEAHWGSYCTLNVTKKLYCEKLSKIYNLTF